MDASVGLQGQPGMRLDLLQPEAPWGSALPLAKRRRWRRRQNASSASARIALACALFGAVAFSVIASAVGTGCKLLLRAM